MTNGKRPVSCDICWALVMPDTYSAHVRWHKTLSNIPQKEAEAGRKKRMDPTELLMQIRRLVSAVEHQEGSSDEALELAGKVSDLDGWLSRRGFLPLPWSKAKERA